MSDRSIEVTPPHSLRPVIVADPIVMYDDHQATRIVARLESL